MLYSYLLGIPASRRPSPLSIPGVNTWSKPATTGAQGPRPPQPCASEGGVAVVRGGDQKNRGPRVCSSTSNGLTRKTIWQRAALAVFFCPRATSSHRDLEARLWAMTATGSAASSRNLLGYVALTERSRAWRLPRGLRSSPARRTPLCYPRSPHPVVGALDARSGVSNAGGLSCARRRRSSMPHARSRFCCPDG